jgi:ADP-heptose:LPS heptosyltransferase
MGGRLRILLVRLSHLGDVVHALPLHHAVRAAHPAARLAWAVQPEFAPLLAGLPGLERTIPFERRAGARAWPRVGRALAEFGADWSIDAQGNVKSALVALASLAPRRSGLAREDWREPFAAGALTDAAPPLGRAAHAVERVLHLARHVTGRESEACFDLGLSAEERAGGESRARTLLPEGGAILHLAPSADVRAWPPARWAELARALAERERVLIVSGPAEEREGRQLARELSGARIAHLVAQRGLRELAALFSAAAGRGARFVGSDSGPTHLAWAAGLPVLILAGPQDERRTGPWPLGAPHRVQRARGAPPCAPCLARSCEHAAGPVCMSGIEPEDVAGSLARLAPAR